MSIDKIRIEYNIRGKDSDRLTDILYQEFTEQELCNIIKEHLTLGRWGNDYKIADVKIDKIEMS